MKYKKIVYVCTAGLLCAVGVFACVLTVTGASLSARAPISIDPQMLYRVDDVIDGDTARVRVGNRTVTVRFLGINTPETVDPRKPVECFGHEASDETKSLLLGRSVRLGQSPGREVRDKYGRYLTYVYRDDGLFVNEFLIREGYAREYTVGKPYSLEAGFKKLESTARDEKMGLWAACAGK